MSLMRSAPLLLLAATLGGWVSLRGGYALWVDSADAHMDAPLDYADAGGIDRWLPPLLPLAEARPPSVAELLAETRLRVQRAPADRRPLVARPLVAQSLGPRPPSRAIAAVSSPPITDQTDFGGQAVINGQSLLLARMLSPLRARRAGTPLALTSVAGPLHRALPDFAPTRADPENRWSAAGWLFARRGAGTPTLAAGSSPGRSLGGSQAGARIGWRPNGGGVEVFGRVVTAGRIDDGAEAAGGVALRPSGRLPVQIIIERRQRLTGPGRNAFAVYAQGGETTAIAGGWRLESYGAAGVVGARRRDLFIEGSVQIYRPVAQAGRLTLSTGGGIWGAAQPGANRLDVGPTLTADAGPATPRLVVDWRQRVAGNAAPPSGPAVTLSIGF